MSRNPSVDWLTLKREYVYAKPNDNVTLSTLAVKHGIARSGLAARAAGAKDEQSWFDEREEFRSRLNEKTLEALADKWAAFETEAREKRMQTANAVLDNFIAQLAPVDEQGNPLPSKVKIASKDAVEWIGVMRQEFAEVRNAGANAKVVDGTAVEMDRDEAKEAYESAMKLLEAGKNGAESAA